MTVAQVIETALALDLDVPPDLMDWYTSMYPERRGRTEQQLAKNTHDRDDHPSA